MSHPPAKRRKQMDLRLLREDHLKREHRVMMWLLPRFHDSRSYKLAMQILQKEKDGFISAGLNMREPLQALVERFTREHVPVQLLKLLNEQDDPAAVKLPGNEWDGTDWKYHWYLHECYGLMLDLLERYHDVQSYDIARDIYVAHADESDSRTRSLI